MKEPFKSGVYRKSEDKNIAENKPISDIVEHAVKTKRLKKSLHQKYDSPLTPNIQRNTRRMLGEKED